MTSRYKWKLKFAPVTFFGLGIWFDTEAVGISLPFLNIQLEKVAY